MRRQLHFESRFTWPAWAVPALIFLSARTVLRRVFGLSPKTTVLMLVCNRFIGDDRSILPLKVVARASWPCCWTSLVYTTYQLMHGRDLQSCCSARIHSLAPESMPYWLECICFPALCTAWGSVRVPSIVLAPMCANPWIRGIQSSDTLCDMATAPTSHQPQ